MVNATVREWSDEEGSGVLDSRGTPNGRFCHYADIQTTGFRTLSPGQQVELVPPAHEDVSQPLQPH